MENNFQLRYIKRNLKPNMPRATLITLLCLIASTFCYLTNYYTLPGI